MSLPGLGLPGLGLEEPSEQHEAVEAAQHELPAGSEWRFEVAFGKFVKVKVCLTNIRLRFDMTKWQGSYSLARPNCSVRS